MNIELKEITIRELTEGFEDHEEKGVVGYGGKLDIRPAYQREFIYKDKQRDAVIDTIFKNYPLNVMYWAVKDDGNFEVIDGQQRTISICEFIEGNFSVKIGTFDKPRSFHNLQNDEQEKILNYKLMVYQCKGTDSEKLEWFKTINIAGEKLTDQELRNAVYSGSWVSDAKRYFSKSGCPAHGMASDYLKGASIREEYLETVIKWISNNQIEEYMAKNQHMPTSIELWNYFNSVINWIQATFPNYRKEMKGIGWGFLYNDFKDEVLDPRILEEEITLLMQDEDVTKKSGIYEYVLTRKEKYLSIRAFTKNQIREAYERQEGICVKCNEQFELKEMEADHIKPWSEGGKTTTDNCQMLCKNCNRIKSNK